MNTPLKDTRITENFGFQEIFQKGWSYEPDVAYRVITEKEYDDMLVKMEQQRQQTIQDKHLIDAYRNENRRVYDYQKRLETQAKTITSMQETEKNLISKLDMAEAMIDTFSEEINIQKKEIGELEVACDELEFGYDELYRDYKAKVITPVCSTNPDIHLVITITG